MKEKKSVIINTVKKGGIFVAASIVTAPAFADTTASINAAIAAAEANMTLVTVGVLTVAAIGFGIGLVTSFLRK
ncbi:hypothetical protein L4D76_19150 [Photobacterium sagamiensis]|uniref:hypothetical protein n=1 Tax=Photobacterium sagamiensis TaxID=2910241 RepID=UPI003D12D214